MERQNFYQIFQSTKFQVVKGTSSYIAWRVSELLANKIITKEMNLTRAMELLTFYFPDKKIKYDCHTIFGLTNRMLWFSAVFGVKFPHNVQKLVLDCKEANLELSEDLSDNKNLQLKFIDNISYLGWDVFDFVPFWFCHFHIDLKLYLPETMDYFRQIEKDWKIVVNEFPLACYEAQIAQNTQMTSTEGLDKIYFFHNKPDIEIFNPYAQPIEDTYFLGVSSHFRTIRGNILLKTNYFKINN